MSDQSKEKMFTTCWFKEKRWDTRRMPDIRWDTNVLIPLPCSMITLEVLQFYELPINQIVCELPPEHPVFNV
ncbi:hypothetical protein POUND7_006701 [Theobroma cacao]